MSRSKEKKGKIKTPKMKINKKVTVSQIREFLKEFKK